jgi:ketosteroid isomerase-like protein
VYKKINILICIALSILLYACSSCNNEKKVSNIVRAEDSMATYKMLPVEQQEVIDIVYSWNALHDSSNVDSLEKYYSNPVLFFKKKISRDAVISSKKYKIKHADTYRERIIGRIGIYASDTGDYKCEFLKLVTINNKPKVYHSYLIFKKQAEDGWRIIVESDKESDLQPELVSLFEKFQESESLSSGDFNGDNEKEDLIVIKPERDTSGKYVTTETKISFTNMDLPEIIIPNCIGVNVLNENDVDGDGSDDFSVVVKTPEGDVGDVLLYSFKRGKWHTLANFKAPDNEVFSSRQNLIEFAGSGNIKYRTVEKTADDRDSLVVKTISTW